MKWAADPDTGKPLDPDHPWNRDETTLEDQRERFVQRQLDSLAIAYRDGSLGALNDVLKLCEEYNRPLPEWAAHGLSKLVKDAATGARTGERGRRHWIKRYLADMCDIDRYECVLEGREHGVKWDSGDESVYEAAADVLSGTFSDGTPAAIRESYRRVRRRMKTAPGRYKALQTVRLRR